jgi:hypothetical protein
MSRIIVWAMVFAVGIDAAHLYGSNWGWSQDPMECIVGGMVVLLIIAAAAYQQWSKK